MVAKQMDADEQVNDAPLHLTNPRKWALLTGAGFSANWGFPVAQQIWSYLVSDPEVQSQELLRAALLSGGTFNYEDALARAQSGEFGQKGKEILEACIGRVFDGIQTRLNNDDIGLYNEAMVAFLSCFTARSRDETGLIFTLNQDMLLEATAGLGHTEGGAVRPGAEKTFKQGAVLRANYGIHIPKLGAEPNVKMRVDSLSRKSEASFSVQPGGTYYLKLHGSWDWEGPDREIGMIMGGRKEATILESPLLSFYQEVFGDFLCFGDRRLLIIGYGFGDPHINRSISKGIEDHGLRVFIWDRCSPEDMWRKINEKSATIWRGLCGYSQASLKDLLTLEGLGTLSREAQRQFTSIFGDETPPL